MRVMLLQNIDPLHGWANGVRARLFPYNSWGATKPAVLRRTLIGPAVAERVDLSDVHKYGDFNVRIVKDQERTIAKTFRHNAYDVQTVGAHNETGSHRIMSASFNVITACNMPKRKIARPTFHLLVSYWLAFPDCPSTVSCPVRPTSSSFLKPVFLVLFCVLT